MNKLRVLNNNFAKQANTALTAHMFKMQRLYIVSPVFVIGDVLTTGAIVVNMGSLQTPISNSSYYIDVRLVDEQFPMIPNMGNQTITAITNGVVTTNATHGIRISPNHPGFTVDNTINPNRNRVCTALNNIENIQYSFDSLSISISNLNVFSGIMNSLVILDHNLTSTATITIRLGDANNATLFTHTMLDITNALFSTGTNYYAKNSKQTLTLSDKASFYKYKDAIKLYLPSSVFSVYSVQIDIEDLNNTEAISIGNIYIGDFYEVKTNMRNNWSIDIIDPSVTTYAQSPFSVVKDSFDIMTLRFSNVSSDEKQFWLDLYRRNGTNTDFMLDLFNGSPDPNDSYYVIYGRFSSNKFRILNNFLSKFSFQVGIRESI